MNKSSSCHYSCVSCKCLPDVMLVCMLFTNDLLTSSKKMPATWSPLSCDSYSATGASPLHVHSYSICGKCLVGMLLLPHTWCVRAMHVCRTRFVRVLTVTWLQRTVSCFVTKLCLMLVVALAFSACLLQLPEQDLSLALTSQTSSIKPWTLLGICSNMQACWYRSINYHRYIVADTFPTLTVLLLIFSKRNIDKVSSIFLCLKFRYHR